ncbi:MAG TPA: DUF4974 domain-containing protein [Bacteroides sp.]|nr:DUF4974 domain-containing protein [Bacteroides sp.]
MKRKAKQWSDLARYLSGEMEMQEEMAFRGSIENDKRAISELEAMEKTWKFDHEDAPDNQRNTGEAWGRLQKRLKEDGLLEKGRDSSRGSLMMPLLRVAATILLVLAIGGPVLYFGIMRKPGEPGVESHAADRGVSTVDLPDGSRVYLNEGAEISYPSVFEQNRSVRMRGEAFFEVMSDPVNPFTVRSGNVVVSVLGTSFNIKQSAPDRNIEVYVESGRVRMSVEESRQFITLEEGELGRTEAAGVTRSVQEDPNYMSWKTKDFKFVNTELDRVISKLEEAYHVEIRVEEAGLHNLRLTSTYREQSIEAILETIAAAFGMTVHKEAQIYYLTNQ